MVKSPEFWDSEVDTGCDPPTPTQAASAEECVSDYLSEILEDYLEHMRRQCPPTRSALADHYWNCKRDYRTLYGVGVLELEDIVSDAERCELSAAVLSRTGARRGSELCLARSEAARDIAAIITRREKLREKRLQL